MKNDLKLQYFADNQQNNEDDKLFKNPKNFQILPN